MLGMKFGRALGAVMICSLLGLAGCAGADPVASAPTATPTLEEPAPSASPSAPETVEPETAKEFIRRWPVVETEMLNSGQTDPYRRISAQCRACTGIADRVDRIYSKGGFIQTTTWTIRSIKSIGGGERDNKSFLVRTMAPPTRFQETSSGPVKTYPGGPINYQVLLRLRAGRWVLADVVDVGAK